MIGEEKRKSLLAVSDGKALLAVKAKPGTARMRAPRIVPLAGDKFAVEITVAEAPEGGKANKAITDFLASGLGLRKGDVSIKTGAAGRFKQVEITVVDNGVLERINQWLAGLPFK